jgi:hypothetical protein
MRWGPNGGWRAIAFVAVLIGPAQELAGQDIESQRSRADSVEFLLRQRLQALGRPPRAIPDSIRADSIRADSILADSVRRASASPTSSSFPQDDSTLVALMRSLTGYDATSYVARRAYYETDRQELFLYGDTLTRASLRQPTGDEVSVDSVIRFNQRSQVAEALGAPIYTPVTGDPVESDRLVFDTQSGAGSAYQARTNYTQAGGTTWRVTGDLPLVANEVAYGDHSRFTSCELEIPHYHFETPELKIIQGRLLVARPVKLYFADVPVAWLPFVFQSLTAGRSSGILPPRFSVNDIVRTNGGYQRRVSNIGFYWVVNDYMDATVALDWFDNNYTGITANLRYQWLRQFLNGNLTVRRFWRSEGRRELSFNTNQSWQMSERTSLTLSAQYATSTSFIRRNSFDPREVTGQIRSQGGFSRRFDWGTLNISGDRSQSLSDDRVSMSLPRVGLSLRPITLLSAPTVQSSWYNNLTWNGGLNFSRRITDNPTQEGSFSFSGADRVDMDGNANSSFTLGRFSVGQSLRVSQGIVRDVPPEIFPDPTRIVDPAADTTGASLVPPPSSQILAGPGFRSTDITSTDVNWTTSINYQQPLIGTTTLTPSVSFSGSARKSDTLSVASGFVASPTRISFGASLKADFYGFYPGIAGFQAIRHKITPTFDYSWAPEVRPTELQEQVFGSTTLRRQSAISIGFNQTWEGKRIPDEGASSTGGTPSVSGDSLSVEGNGAEAGQEAAGALGSADEGGPQRLEQGEIVNILSLRTSALRYNFVSADESGEFLRGFETTLMTNTITSDYLRGLTINMSHDLFEDEATGEGAGLSRKFAPHLTRLNFGFTLDPSSGIVRLLGLGRSSGTEPPAPAPVEESQSPDPMAAMTDEASIIPGGAGDRGYTMGSGMTAGEWRANLSYALSRPRAGGASVSQIMNINAMLSPTPSWNVTWSTAYDLQGGGFNDHRISLTRDLHRWDARFDFLRTATGNWSFRFEVALRDNRDLHVDYEQRSAIDRLLGL